MRKFHLILLFFLISVLAYGCGSDSNSNDPTGPNSSGSVARNLARSITGGTVSLSWDGYVGDEWIAFNVYYLDGFYDGDLPEPLATVTTEHHTIPDLDDGVYHYCVTTVHIDGHISNPTNEVEVVIDDEGSDPSDDPDED